MRFGIVLPRAAEWPATRALVRRAEAAGVGSVWVADGYADGFPEAFTTASAVASVTDTLEVGAYMVNASLRDPVILSRSAASVDRLAPGRVRVLLGTGWDRTDYEAVGTEFPSREARARRTREALATLKAETPVNVEVAGVSDDVIRLAATTADGWALSADALDAYFERYERLREACIEAGRSLDEVRVSCTLPCSEEAASRIDDFATHGMDEIRIRVRDTDDIERLVSECAVVRPR